MSVWPAPTSIAVYIHWPFCAKKCPYCDFAVTVRAQVDEAAVVSRLEAELTQRAARYPSPRPRAHSVYFGGGTPSLMQPSSVARLLAAIEHGLGLAVDCEITLEANPTDAEADKLAAFAQAGVNRLSLGVQSLDDDELLVLGRNHDAASAARALDRARAVFDNFSVDVMYALPRQAVGGWAARLDALLAWSPPHVSLYQLTIEPGTVFEKAVQRGFLAPFDNDAAADLYTQTQAHLARAGYGAYEVSNFAKPGFESRHNLSYWRYQDYIGVGPGAHGRYSWGGVKHSSENHRAFRDWMDQPVAEAETLSVLDADEEAFLMSMRSREGAILGDALVFNKGAVERLIEAGFLERHANSFRATPAGWLRLDAMSATLLA